MQSFNSYKAFFAALCLLFAASSGAQTTFTINNFGPVTPASVTETVLAGDSLSGDFATFELLSDSYLTNWNFYGSSGAGFVATLFFSLDSGDGFSGQYGLTKASTAVDGFNGWTLALGAANQPLLSAGTYIALLTGTNTNPTKSVNVRYRLGAPDSEGYIGAPRFQATFVTAVPEPESYAMMLAGLGLMGAIARRRSRKSA